MELKKITPSAIISFNECPLKYKLAYIDKRPTKESIAFAFGKAAHEAIQNAFKERNNKLAKEQFLDLFKKFFDEAKNKLSDKEINSYDELVNDGNNIFDRFHEFVSLDEVEDVECEEKLIESVNENWTFSGRLDLVFKVKNKWHIVDIKTSKSGWRLDKLQNVSIISQPILYKYFWAKKHNVEQNKILTSFLILKKKVVKKPIESLKVSSGPITIDKCVSLMNNTIQLIDKGFFFKGFNKNVCKWCEFNNTNDCVGSKEEY